MTLEEILALQPQEMITELKKGRNSTLPDIKKYIKAIDPSGHDIFDPAKRPDKLIKETDDRVRTEPVARIGLAMQKLIVKRAVAFVFGNPVELTMESEDATDKKIYDAVVEILSDAKIDSLNRRVAKSLFSCTEVAELWYPQPLKEGEEPLYGIDSKFKLRMKVLDPMKGENLYPYFDEYGDMIAFSREYIIQNGDKKKTYIEIYTDTQIFKYDASEGTPVLVEGYPAVNAIGKIPIVYGQQDQSDFEDVQGMIDRLEKLLSNFADTNDYHSAPTIFIKGSIKGFSKKGESGKIIEGDKDSTAEYLSWTSAPAAVQLEITTLLQMIHTISQTPDISFESVKGLGTTSGKAMRMMFLDAHLKVEDHMEVFDEYLQRRISILKAFVGSASTSLAKSVKKTKITSKVTPYMIDDEADTIDILMTATGNKPILSQKSAVHRSGLVGDADAEFAQIQAEETAAKTIDTFTPAQ